ncbi:MAG: sterol carrier family protein [Sporichthyaceae bacterium]
MPARRRIDATEGRAALAAWAADPGAASRDVVATAVRWTLQELTDRHPGASIEVRVPPFGAVQCIAGTTHRRGTPPNVVETDPATWLALATGRTGWGEAVTRGLVHASGAAADLSAALPLR